MNNSAIFDANNLRQRRVKEPTGQQENVLSSKIFTTSTDFSPSRYASSTKKGLPQHSMNISHSDPIGATPNPKFSSPPRGLPRNSLLASTENDYNNRLSQSNARNEIEPLLDYTPSNNRPTGGLTQQRDLILHSERDSFRDMSSFSHPTPSSYIAREDIHEGLSQRSLPKSYQMTNSQTSDSNTLDKLTGLADRTPLSAEVALWPHWVVVFGFNPHADHDSPSSLHNILRLFQEFGEIDDYSPGVGNWLFIRFVSSHVADRVLSLDNTFLTPHLMIGVRKLNAKIAREMNLSVRSDGRLCHGEGVNRESLAGAAFRRELDPDFESIMRPPKKSKDICTRIFEYFMAY